jgi:hypothetical protein
MTTPQDFSPAENEKFEELEKRIAALEAKPSLTPIEDSALLELLDHFGIRQGY